MNDLKIVKKTTTEFFAEYQGREIEIVEQDDDLWFVCVMDIQTEIYESHGYINYRTPDYRNKEEDFEPIDYLIKQTINNLKNIKLL